MRVGLRDLERVEVLEGAGQHRHHLPAVTPWVYGCSSDLHHPAPGPATADHRGRRRVTFSITMFVALLGFMNGLNDLLDGLILNRTPHVRLYNEIQPSPVQPIQRDSLRTDAPTSSGPSGFKSELERIRNALGIMDALGPSARAGPGPKGGGAGLLQRRHH